MDILWCLLMMQMVLGIPEEEAEEFAMALLFLLSLSQCASPIAKQKFFGQPDSDCSWPRPTGVAWGSHG